MSAFDSGGGFNAVKHARAKAKAQRNGNYGTGRTSWSVTDEERIDMVRRVLRFENPGDVARIHNVTRHTVLNAVKAYRDGWRPS